MPGPAADLEPAAHSRLKLARQLTQLPAVSTRWAEGDLGADHAALIASARTDDTADAFAEAESWLADTAVELELRRTAAQRRADALVEMAVRAEMCRTPDSHRPRPLVIVVAGLEALASGLAELWNETPISPRQLARILAEDPDIERYVYGSGEQPIAFNARARFFTGKLRRAIQVRDRFCTGEGCDRPADFCDVDHIEPVSGGGATTPGNGRSVCNPDNRARPRRRFRHGADP